MFKVIMIYNGEEEEQDDVFETEQQAKNFTDYLRCCSAEGAEVLHYSDPIEYPDEDDYGDLEFEIIEIPDN